MTGYCYRRDCGHAAMHRIFLANDGWRRWLRRAPRTYPVCNEHRFDPISRRHAGQLRHV